MSNKLNSTVAKILFSTFLLGLPVFATVSARADMQEGIDGEDMEMKQDHDSMEMPDGAYDSIDEGADGEPVVTIPETEETIEVIVKNNTNATIDYQAIGYTENQTLEGGEAHALRGLPVPVVIRAARQDDGFVTTEPMINEEGVLEVSLDEAGERNLGVVRIEEDGGVYISQEDSEASMDSEMDTMMDTMPVPEENMDMDDDM